jgi:uncharacterized protein
MPAGSLLAVIDDIASVLDDVAVLTKVAAKKTAGVLGDDLALNAEQVAGVHAARELPVVWAVAKGSAVNKAILVPAALLISAVAPWAITPLLVAGGTFLCFEGSEKLVHKLLHRAEAQAEHEQHLAAVVNPEVDLVAVERDKIRGAIRTDFVLSAEIVVIALGTVATAPFVTRLTVLTGLSALMTVGVYGLVAGIVKLDDAGELLVRRGRRGAALASLQLGLGSALLLGAPWLMKALSVAGTVAMFLVGGGILTHALPGLHGWVHLKAENLGDVPVVGALLETLLPSAVDGAAGLISGNVVLGLWLLARRLRAKAA